MRTLTAALALVCLMSANGARADEVKDLDKWAADFTEAVSHTDMTAMVALIRPYVPEKFDIAAVEENGRKIIEKYGHEKALTAEQFSNSQLGSFAKRINVAVVYDGGQMYYSLVFIKRHDGWRLNGYQNGPLFDKVQPPT